MNFLLRRPEGTVGAFKDGSAMVQVPHKKDCSAEESSRFSFLIAHCPEVTKDSILKYVNRLMKGF